ncbi:putative orfan [Tupanvirus soda lake]|uniref:Orfan n=2 Tax=Tupanvirus TaxID=2094720 RepID=A0AC62ADC2_9VIRU|nr:putative orfan [Tupanvirus soda lake]QKU35749.1 putative orfan [Tupanvirus soda lake]
MPTIYWPSILVCPVFWISEFDHYKLIKLLLLIYKFMTNAHKTNAHKTNAHKTNAHKKYKKYKRKYLNLKEKISIKCPRYLIFAGDQFYPNGG